MHHPVQWQGSRLNGWRVVVVIINGKYLTNAIHECTASAWMEVLQTTRPGFANLIVTLRLVIIICRGSSNCRRANLFSSSSSHRQLRRVHRRRFCCGSRLNTCAVAPRTTTTASNRVQSVRFLHLHRHHNNNKIMIIIRLQVILQKCSVHTFYLSIHLFLHLSISAKRTSGHSKLKRHPLDDHH